MCGTYEHKRIVSNLVDLLSLGCERMRINPAVADSPIDRACVAVLNLQGCILVRVCVNLDTAACVCTHTGGGPAHGRGAARLAGTLGHVGQPG